jgi:pSer/pThr/pTyr-binding forkhead associated (FHA) protein
VCQVRIDDPRASGEHAAIIWDGGRWAIRDLSSRNGTWLDGARIAVEDACFLERGTKIGFGASNPVWEVASLDPPSPVAKGPRGVVEGRGGLLALPHEDDPDALVYLSEEGHWRL